MAKLLWDKSGERIYETGTKMGVLYVMNNGTYSKGVAWNGLSAVTESPSGAEENAIYADDIKYLALRSAEEFGATIEAYTYPPEWEECDGSINLNGLSIGQQKRKPFGFSFRTVIGNDEALDDYGYKLHLVYNATAAPSERAYQSVNDSPEAVTFSWEISTTPVALTSKDTDGKLYRPTAHLVIDSTKADDTKLKRLEALLYGTDADADNNVEATDPTLPSPDEVIAIFKTV